MLIKLGCKKMAFLFQNALLATVVLSEKQPFLLLKLTNVRNVLNADE